MSSRKSTTALELPYESLHKVHMDRRDIGAVEPGVRWRSCQPYSVPGRAVVHTRPTLERRIRRGELEAARRTRTSADDLVSGDYRIHRAVRTANRSGRRRGCANRPARRAVTAAPVVSAIPISPHAG